jgi:hypothetical protein
MRGVRDFGQGDYLADPAWRRGYGLLAKHGLVVCKISGLGMVRQPLDGRRRCGRRPAQSADRTVDTFSGLD